MEEIITDIESIGLSANDKITVVGFFNPAANGFTIHYLIPEQLQNPTNRNAIASEILETIADTFPNQVVQPEQIKLRGCVSEEDVLKNSYGYVEKQQDTLRVVGYNTDSYDLPTLRSRSVINGVNWGLSGCHSRDIYTLFKYKFNTTGLTVDGFKKKQKKKFGEEIGAPVDDDMYSSELTEAIEEYGYTPGQLDEFITAEGLDRPTKETNTLDAVHEILGGEITQYDPFEDSQEAVEAYNNGDIAPVIIHNIVDLLATNELNNVISEYVSKRDITDRQL